MSTLTSPTFTLTFRELGTTAIARGIKGTVAVIVRDTAVNTPCSISRASEIPKEFGKENLAYINRTFQGYVDSPKKVIVYPIGGTIQVDSGEVDDEGNAVLEESEISLSDALEYMAAQDFDYIVGPADCTAGEAEEIADWIKEQHNQAIVKFKAVLPDYVADDPHIINFSTGEILCGTTKYGAAAYCSRIAGMLAGTPMTSSATYAPLTEVTNVSRLTREEMDAAVGAGKLIIFWDGKKAKLNRAVNSFTTITDDKKDSFKKIKIVEVMDLIRTDVNATVEDKYIGKYSNSYDNKQLLIAALRDYFEGLRLDGLIQEGYTVDLDTEAIAKYILSTGVNSSEMDEDALRKANTGSHVFLKVKCKILDAIEDVDIDVEI